MGARRNRWEFRDIPYRPPRQVHDRRGDASLILRFMKRYVWPFRWPVLLCVALMSVNTCYSYIQSYYTKVAVDDVLQVGAVVADLRARVSDSSVVSHGRHLEDRPARQGSGYISEEDRKDDDTRPAWAGRRLLGLFAIYALTIVVFNGLSRIVQRLQSRVSKSITERLREEMHDKIVGMSMAYHVANSPGRLMSRILSDVDVVQSQLMQLLVTALSNIAMFAVGVAILFSINARIGFIVLAAMIPYVIVAARVRTEIRAVNVELRHTNSCLWGYASQKLDAVRAIVAYGREKMESLFFHRLSSCFLRDAVLQQQLSAVLQRAAALVTQFTGRGLFVYCAYLVLDGSMTLGTMMYVNSAVNNLFVPVVTLTQLAVQVSALLVVLQRISYTLDSPQEVPDDPAGADFPMPVRSGIRLRHVTFGWDPKRPPVIDDLSLDIPVGSWVCIMGASGCGKSTLLQLIARLYDPQSGEIDIDGVNLAHIKFRSLRQRLSYVPQEAQILSGTIRDNIIYGHPDATPSMIMDAAKAADAHDFIMELPVKYETVTGEKGTTLSGGQRQRISIARALLTKPEILILDDCTSALDANTERKLQETFSRILAGKTAVIVSQRVSMAMRCQRIVVLDHGRILEQGTHDELLALGGYYAKLYAVQTG
ncbi:MAG: ABC transporter ATP-binding protein [Kiritimatiellae bacterium]|nr:ABC transporter ATP-binding protein [Kiritimatiellia bacterium]